MRISRSFDYYEFAGIIIPGTLAVFGIAFIFNVFNIRIESVGATTVLIMLMMAYPAGHFLQELGYSVEDWLWKFRYKNCEPDEIFNSSYRSAHNYFNDNEIEAVKNHIHKRLKIKTESLKSPMSRDEWKKIKRRIEADIFKNNPGTKFDIFNGIKGFSRGLLASLSLLFVLNMLAFLVQINVLHFPFSENLTDILPDLFTLLISASILLFSMLLSKDRLVRYSENLIQQTFAEFLLLQLDANNIKVNSVPEKESFIKEMEQNEHNSAGSTGTGEALIVMIICCFTGMLLCRALR